MTIPRPTGRFPRSRRIRKRPEFQRVQARGRRVVTPHFVLLLHARDDAGEPTVRLGVTASRRIGSAVRRNRAKRLIREAFRATSPLWSRGIDLVVIVRRPLLALSMQQVVAEWQQVAKLIRRRAREAEKDREKRQSALAEPAQTTQTRA